MKRTTTALSAFAAGAALLLAGCGSDSAGTASPAAPSSQQQVASSEDTASEMTSEAPTDESMTDESMTDETMTSEAPTDESMTDESSSDESMTDESSSEDTAPTTTVGGGGDLDETSVAWFDTYCGGLAPAFEEIKSLTDMDMGSDPADTLKTLSKTFTAMGTSFTDTAKSLDGVPAPTFEGGDTVATTTTKALSEFGPKFTKLGTELAKADPDDPKSLEKLQDLGKDMADVQELGKFAVDPETLAAIKEIPSCEPIFSMGG